MLHRRSPPPPRPDLFLPRPPLPCPQIMWLMYECPETRFDGLAMRFMDIRKRVYEVPELGKKATMVCIPTTSGTGSEVTPFSVVTDELHGAKYPLAGRVGGRGWGVGAERGAVRGGAAAAGCCCRHRRLVPGPALPRVA